MHGGRSQWALIGAQGVAAVVAVATGASGGTPRYCRSNFEISANAGAATTPPKIAARGLSTTTSTASRGFATGTKPTNEAVYWPVVYPCGPGFWAVPVLPATVYPGIWAALPVAPCSST